MSSTNSAKAGTQTFLIECNRGNSVIDAKAPDSNNGKWTTETNFSFKRGDRVGVEAIMIESTGAGSQQQTIEFSGENVKQGETIQDWTDDVIVLEFGFYVKNNAEKTINLPLEFTHNLNATYGIDLRINSGEWVKSTDVVAGTPAEVAYKFQYPGIAPPAGFNTAGGYTNGGFNFKQSAVGSAATAYDVFAFKDSANVVIPFGLAGTVVGIKSIVLSNTTDANPNANILVDAAKLSIPLPPLYQLQGQNTPFSSGLSIAIKNAAGIINSLADQVITSLEPDYTTATPPVYTGRLKIVFAEPTTTILVDTAINMEIIPVKPNLQIGTEARPIRWGTSAGSATLAPIAPATAPTYEPGARIGIGLYNGSAPFNNFSPGNSAKGLKDETMRLGGGAGLWEQTRVWGRVDANEIPALGSSALTTPASVRGGRELKTRDLRNYKDNRPYILVSPDYQAPQPTPNGLGMCPKLQPMTAYVVIRADSSFEDVNNLAQKFTEAFHAINPLVLGQGKDLDKYLDNQEFPYNNLNNALPLTSTGYYSKLNATNTAGTAVSTGYTNSVASLYNRVEPLWIGNLVKCLPANLTTSPDWKNQPGNPYYYYPNDKKDYLKVGDKNDWNWNNLIYGNMGLVNFNKCYSGDRFIRCSCWDGNTTTHPHRDIPRPVVLNTQLKADGVSQPAPPTTSALFGFVGVNMDTYEPIFTNIEYTDENLDTIQECMRHSERYITERRAYLPNDVIDDYTRQEQSPYWEYEMDIGMSRGDLPLNTNTNTNGIMTKVETNWISEYPLAASTGDYPSKNDGGTNTPSQSYPGNGGEIEIQQGRQVGRVQVFSRFQDGWLTGTGINNSPKDTLENIGSFPLGTAYAFCAISPPVGGSNIPLKQDIMYKSKDRNIGALPYIYNDEDGVSHTLTFFMVSKIYQPDTTTTFNDEGQGRSTWELDFFGWGDFFGFSPQFGYDQPAVIPVNPDNPFEPQEIITAGAGSLTTPAVKWRWNNQNYVWCGANDAAMVFDNTNNRFTLSQLYTEKNLSAVDGTTQAPAVPPAPPNTPATNETQLGETYAGINTNYAGTKLSYLTTATNKPQYYKETNQGIQDAVCGVYLNAVYYAPKNWTPPTNINPKNIYSPGSGSYVDTQPHLNPATETPLFPYSTYANLTEENREQFLAPLTKATADNWTGNILDKMGFDFNQIIPPYGGQTNRYSSFTYGRTDIATMYEGTKPLMLNAETDVAADLDLNVFTYLTGTNDPNVAALSGTPLYTNGLINNNPLNLGDMRSASLIANRIPTLFACPFYLVISDICPTQFQSGSTKQDCIFYGLKNYGSGQYFYVFGSNYSQMVDTDRTITQVNTEIRNPLTGRLARLSKNSCIIYKVERDITIPAIEVDIQGQLIQEGVAQGQNQDEMTGMMNELKKLVSIQSGEKAELSTLVKEDTGSHDVLTGIRNLMKRHNIHAKTAVGITDNIDFGGALRKPDESMILTREEAEKIVRNEIQLEQAESGVETKQADTEVEIRDRVEELMKDSKKGKRTDIDPRDLYKDLAKLLVEKALRALPITMGGNVAVGNPVHIATAIRNSLSEFNPLLEKIAREVESGELDINDAIKAIEEPDLFLSAKGKVLSKKGRITKGEEVDNIYMGIPDFIDEIADSWFERDGKDIESLVRRGMENEELGIIRGEEGGYEPMDLEEIRKQRAETIQRMKILQHKSAKKAGNKGATEDMILEGRNLIEAESRKISEEKMRNSEYTEDKKEKKERFDAYYKEAKREQEKEFQSNPLQYIRQFAKSGEGVQAHKLLELQERHRRDEDAVRTVESKSEETET